MNNIEHVHDHNRGARFNKSYTKETWPLDSKLHAICQLKMPVKQEIIQHCIDTIEGHFERLKTQDNTTQGGDVGHIFIPEYEPWKPMLDILAPFKEDFFHLGYREEYSGEIVEHTPWMFCVSSGPQDIHPHRDTTRHCGIYLPIFPYGHEYGALEMYHNDMTHFLYNAYENEQSYFYVWNPQRIHAVFHKTLHPRYNFQVAIDMTYEEFIEKYSDYMELGPQN